MTGNKIDILYCGRSRFLLLEKFFLSCLNYNRSQSPSQRQWVCDENTEDKVLWLVASVGKVVLCESLSSTINIIPSLDNDNYAQETRWSCPGHWSATHTIIHYWTSSTHWMTFYLAAVIVDCRCKDVDYLSLCVRKLGQLLNLDLWNLNLLHFQLIDKVLNKNFPWKRRKIIYTLLCCLNNHISTILIEVESVEDGVQRPPPRPVVHSFPHCYHLGHGSWLRQNISCESGKQKMLSL